MSAQAVAAGRTEDPIVSHNWLLVLDGQQGTLTGRPRLAIADFATRHPVDDHSVTCELAPGHESVKASRNFTRATLRRWGMAEVSDAAELVVSELVTNALRHGLLSARRMPEEHPIRLRLLRQTPYLMCLVTDPGSDVPVRRDSDACAESGRGLQVVESCSLQWGWQPLDDDGKVVWALMQAQELAAPGRALRPPQGPGGGRSRKTGSASSRPGSACSRLASAPCGRPW